MNLESGSVVADLHGVGHVVRYTTWFEGNVRPVLWCEEAWCSRNLVDLPVAGPPTCFWCAVAR